VKKLLLLLFIVYSTITAYGQTPSTPNGNFEQWISGSCDNPQNYSNTSNSSNFFRSHIPFNVTKTTDAYHGTYAAQLTTNTAVGADTSFGYFVNANPDGDPSTWKGGMAYNQKPTGIRGYYKYNVATADSATIVVAFSKAGSNIGSYIFSIGGIHTAYTLFNFPLSPALTVTPDSVVLAFLSCKLGNGQPHGPAGSTLIIDSVSFTGVSSQPALMNGDFELWQSQTYNTPSDWFLQSGMGEGVNRTTDAKAGSYAVELTTYTGDNNGTPIARAGWASTGYYPNNCIGGCNEQGGFPFSNQVDTLTFWYKYTPSGSDSATINLNFKKNGSTFYSTAMNLHSSVNYQYKEIPFSIPGQVPDSVIIDIMSSSWNDTLLSFVGSDLKIDEMHFKSQPLTTGILEYSNENTVTIFPNPASDKLQVQSLGYSIQSLEIYNAIGEKV